MHNYERLLDWSRLLSLFAAVFVADLTIKRLDETYHPFYAAAAVTGFIAIALMHMLELTVTTLFNRAKWVRRFILGDEYIEGVWFDAVVGQGLYGIITIHIRDGHLSMTGEQFDAMGRITATWEDYVIALEGRTLRGVYRAPQFGPAGPTETYGFSTYVFQGSSGKPPMFYSGFFADAAADARKCQLRGSRISDKETLRQLDDAGSRVRALRALVSKSEASAVA